MNAYELAREQLLLMAQKLQLCGDSGHAGLIRSYVKECDQQADRIAELQEFAIWMTGCGYDFTKHEYFNKCRDKLLIGKQDEL